MKNDGSKNSFYELPTWVKDVDDLAEYLKLSFDEGNILKSLWCNIGNRHDATNPLREARKGLHYSQRRLNRYIHNEKAMANAERKKINVKDIEAIGRKIFGDDTDNFQIRFKKNGNV